MDRMDQTAECRRVPVAKIDPQPCQRLEGINRRIERSIPRARFTMSRFYQAVAGHHPRASFAQVNFTDDRVQRRFYVAGGGEPEAFPRALLGNLAAIRAGSPNFRSCLLDGSAHCALPDPAFYALTSGGVSLRDWVAAQAGGEPVPNLPPGG